MRQSILSKYCDWTHGFMMVLVEKSEYINNYDDLKEIFRAEKNLMMME